MADLKKLTVDVQKRPRITLDELRSYAGKANHFATLGYYWRPFLDQVWAALCESKPSNAPAGYVWVKQVRSSLRWLLAFSNKEVGALRREWRYDYYSNYGVKVVIYLDASPFGMGGMLEEDGVITSWFWSELDANDVMIHKYAIGDHKGQQVWESLVALVAVKLWAPRWVGRQTTITMKGDNMSALAMSAKLKNKVSSLINREMSLAMSSSSLSPRFVEHVPGAFNYSPDVLSRKRAPSLRAAAALGLLKNIQAFPSAHDWAD